MTLPNLPLKVRILIFAVKLLFFPLTLLGWLKRLLGFKPKHDDPIDGSTKLFLKTDDEFMYWSVWGTGRGNCCVHWGKVGERGKTRNYTAAQKPDVEALLEKMRGYGFEEWHDYETLDVVWEIDGFGDSEQLKKRYEAQDLLNEELGWFGVGHSFDASTGSGTMEVGCDVVDEEIGRKVIAEILDGTEFSDYVRIERL